MNTHDMPTNLFAVPAKLSEELFQTILGGPNFRIERIISHGHVSPEEFWYDQEEQEWVVLLRGAARLRFEDTLVEMKPGDFLNIPAHQRHRVEWTTPDEPTIWLAVYY
ncbi:cupin 2 domain-containing protein [Gammaproteobacteria bacterium]